MPKPTDIFFNQRTQRSETKTAIVTKYFDAWARVMHGAQRNNPAFSQNKLAYIDLYAGKGKYDDGTPSTPLIILDTVINNPVLSQKVVTIFNEGKKEFAEELWKNIEALPGIEKLKYEPDVFYQPVNEKITKYYEQRQLVPALLFVDPFGYKGLTLDLINAVIRNWGCDCIFFFNYNRLNPAIRNPKVKPHIDALFGEERANELRELVRDMSTEQRESVIIPAITKALTERHANYVIPFRFAREESESTSHYLIFLTKNERGYGIMKDIMGKHSTSQIQGVPTFEFNLHPDKQPLFTMMQKPIDDLVVRLPKDMAGKTMSVEEVFFKHSPGSNYILKNYQTALRTLWEQKRINVNREPKQKNSFAKDIIVTFPSEVSA